MDRNILLIIAKSYGFISKRFEV